MKNRKLCFLLVLLLSLFITTNVYADDYPDDIYDGDYSLKEMLENYNLVTFGKNDLDSHMNKENFVKGNANIFHINSRFLINNNLKTIRMDFLYDNVSLKSYAKTIGKLNTNYSMFFCGFSGQYDSDNCGNIDNPFQANYLPNKLYLSTSSSLNINSTGSFNSTSTGNYMNFERLYDSITLEQKKIKKGRVVPVNNKTAHIGIGGEYYIDDINEIDSIMFDNFGDNKDSLTIITINNTEDIKFPKIYEATENGEGALISTNDYCGMERPNSDYANYYVIDKYYGNIIWNVPNATYIELPSAPFVGHLVAPNADLYGPELHYAGAFLVNSLYLEGNSEAHFYPLNKNISYAATGLKATIIDADNGEANFIEGINSESLNEYDEVNFKIIPNSGYKLKDLVIKDDDDNDVSYEKTDAGYKFIMPGTDVTITPVFEKIKSSVSVEIVNETKDLNIEIEDLTQVEYGKEVNFRVIPVLGYKIKGIKIIDSDNNEIPYEEENDGYKFIMPDKNVTIIPSYEKVANAVNVEDNAGTKEFTIEVNNAKAVVYEDKVRFTVEPKDGYRLEDVEIVDEENNKIDKKKTGKENEYEFIMPATSVTIKPLYVINYEFIEGMGQSFDIINDNNLRFRFNMKYNEFIDGGEIYIDNELVDCECYELSAGSTIIVFKDSCSKKMKNGQHEIVAKLKDGSTCTTDFIISSIKNPNTKDVIIKTFILLIISSLVIVYMYRKEIKKYS